MEIEFTTRVCPQCGKSSSILLQSEQLAAWQRGKLIQDAFPGLSGAERELIKTGIHPECWEIIFPEEEECGS